MSLDVYLMVGNEQVYDANVTHNLNKMAMAAEIYKHLWRPEEIGIERAEQLITPLAKGLSELTSRRAFYVLLNPTNGWGNYEIFVEFVRDYLAACEEFPDASIVISR
jgi:hypothetical protein